MPKALMVLPEEMRQSGQLELGSIPLNAYRRTLHEELTDNPDITPELCIRLVRDMLLIREFETMLGGIRISGKYQDIEGIHLGPAHLSIGQEGVAVGMAYHLKVHDHVFGNHRSHGEFIARGICAIRELKGSRLRKLMETLSNGATLRAVEQHEPNFTPLRVSNGNGVRFSTDEEDELAIDFLIYGLLAEIFGRENGLNKGMGGSIHAFMPPFGIFPNNAIVGGSAGLAVGAALYKKVSKSPGITVASIGDSSLGCGLVWEAMCFASQGQFTRLWEEEYRDGLRVIFNIVNNFYGMGGQPIGETSGFDRLCRAGAGINAFRMHTESIDGNNPLAVADAYKRKMQILEKGGGPVFLDVMCYRQSGHSPIDQMSYRTREEIDAWSKVDPIQQFYLQLQALGLMGDDDLETMKEYARRKVHKACRLALDTKISPRMVLNSRTGLSQMMFSNKQEHDLPGLLRPDDVLIPIEENSRVKRIAQKSRKGLDDDGNPLTFTKAVTYQDAIFEALIYHFYHDSRLIAYGTENREWGGAFGVYAGLYESLPYRRLFNTPISEAAITSTAVGFGLEGGRAVIEIGFADFLGRTGDEVFNQLAKWQSMSGGYFNMSVVLRTSVGSTYGAQHSQEWSSLCAHIPGLKVAFPATPHDAKGIMASALRGSDPVVIFEGQRIYNQVEIFHLNGVPEGYYTIPFGVPAILKEGSDLTIMTIGSTLYRAWEAVQRFERDFGISVELIDGRFLVPFDYEILVDSVKKTGKLILASDACIGGSHMYTVAGELTQLAFDYLDAPVAVIGAPNWIAPPAELTEWYYPQPGWFLDAYHTQIQALLGYTLCSDKPWAAYARV